MDKIDKKLKEGRNYKPLKWDKIVLDELGKRISGERKAREIIFLCALGNLVTNSEPSSFNLLVHSESSAGKDYLVKNVLKMFNPYKIITRTRISRVVLNYWKPWLKDNLKPSSWDEKVLYLPDCSEDILNCEALKLLCSDGSHITISNLRAFTKFEDIEILGKPVIIITTANSTPNLEIQNRFSTVKLDESPEQTERIHYFVPEEYGKNTLDFVSRLFPCEVKITSDMRNKIARVFPTKLLRERRNFNRFLDFVKAVVVFHQETKLDYVPKSILQKLTAEWKDYDIAKDVFMNLYCGVAEVPLNQRQKEIVEIMQLADDPLEVKEIHNRLKNDIEIRNLRNHLESLKNLGILEEFSLSNAFNRYVKKYGISEDYLDKSPIILPNSEDIKDKDDKDDKDDKVGKVDKDD